MKTELFETVNQHKPRHAVCSWNEVPADEDRRPMDFGDAALVAGLTALVFTLGVIVTVFCTVLMG